MSQDDPKVADKSVQKHGGKRKSNTENKNKGSIRNSAGPSYSKDKENDPKEGEKSIQKRKTGKSNCFGGYHVWRKQQKEAGLRKSNKEWSEDWKLLNDEEKRPFFEEAKIIKASFVR